MSLLTLLPPADPAAVTYRLWIEVPAALEIPVGRLGPCRFPAGRYSYVGSARRNLEARVARHCGRARRLRWHIDYLLSVAAVRVTAVERFAAPECAVNQATGGTTVVPGFGASDCRAGCHSHLRWAGPVVAATAL